MPFGGHRLWFSLNLPLILLIYSNKYEEMDQTKSKLGWAPKQGLFSRSQIKLFDDLMVSHNINCGSPIEL